MSAGTALGRVAAALASEEIGDGWRLTAEAPGAPAAVRDALAAGLETPVPSTSHTVLIDAGLIGDPYRNDAEDELRWTFDVDWRFARPLALAEAAEGERVDLVFDGIDTIAEVALGEERLGRTANMHRSYRFDVTRLADGAERELVVAIESATRVGEAERERLGSRPSAYGYAPGNMIRKMACSFGWDWGPDLRTAGIWRPVRIERWRTARIASVRPIVDVRGTTGLVDVHVEIERSGLEAAGDVAVSATVAGVEASASVPAGADAALLRIEVEDAELWWPVGHGVPALSELTVAIGDSAEPLDAWTRRIGFRSVAIERDADEHGQSFRIVVNGEPVFVKGVNWIPDEHLLTRISDDRVARRLRQTLDANCNLVRVWGGGIYESEAFYRECDEAGLLVWQDFLLACAAYPEESPLWEEFEAEAREHVTRLTAHPSLVVWNGGNENLWGHEDWGWKDALGDATWGERYATQLFADIVAELAPSSGYSENSPVTPGVPADVLHPNDPDHGLSHEWGVWNRLDYAEYRSSVPRFCSEFGFQGPPAWRTLTDAVTAADGGPLAEADEPHLEPTFLVHQKAHDGNGKLDRGMAPHLGVPARFEDWHWAGQLNQARAIRHAIEHYRSWWPRTAGAIVWQLNDCWPVVSWSAIDHAERPKPLLFALEAAFAPRQVSVQRRDGAAVVALVNDSGSPWRVAVDAARVRFDGERLAGTVVEAEVAPRSVAILPIDDAVAAPGSPASEALVVTAGAARAVEPFAEDVDADLDAGALDATIEAVDGGAVIRLRASSLVRDVVVHADRLAADAVADRGLVTLLAGEETTIGVRAPGGIDVAGVDLSRVVRSANDLSGVPQRQAAGTVAIEEEFGGTW